MARPSWSGFLRFNLISIPVSGYNAAVSGGGKIGFHMLHAACHNRIKYKKVCPVHGEVPDGEIVSGYEAAKGQYVVVEKEERATLKAEDEKTIDVDTFVDPAAIDPVYYSGRSYFLVPGEKVAQKPYAVLLDAMQREERFAVARVVFAGRAQVAVVRPVEGVLAMSLLSFDEQLKKPADFADEVGGAAVAAEERKLTETLIEAATAEGFELAKYKDDYSARVAQLVERKSKGKKHSPTAAEEAPAVINLMDALRKSLDQARAGRHGPGKKPRRGHARKTA